MYDFFIFIFYVPLKHCHNNFNVFFYLINSLLSKGPFIARGNTIMTNILQKNCGGKKGIPKILLLCVVVVIVVTWTPLFS